MEMSELEYGIKKSLCHKVDKIEPSEENFAQILVGIGNSPGRKTFKIGNERYLAAFLCALLIISATFMLSDNTRAFAKETLSAIKTVFMIDKNNNVIEKPTTYSFLQPALNKNTQSSDSDLSKQMGVKISFPQEFYGDFKLEQKAEAVGFTRNIDYETFTNLQATALQAFDSNDVFKSLDKYQPYRSVGAIYSNKQGARISAVVYNRKIPITVENMNITDRVPTKVGNQDVEWISLSYPVYPDNDITKKPTTVASTSFLFWSIGETTYQIWPMDNKSLSMAETVKFAESYMAAQK